MQDIKNQALQLQAELALALGKLGFAGLESQLRALEAEALQPGFWNDSGHAQEVSKKQSKLERRINPWATLKREVEDVVELCEIGDEDMVADLAVQLDLAARQFATLKEDLKFSGPYDDNDVIIGIYAGAGGADAQDWASMLRRMYTRWAEKDGYSIVMLDESVSEEGGIKSATFELSGPFAYGRLKGEHGVHRLVRLSPFNAESRETSFAKVDVLPKIDQPEALVIDDKDLRIDVYRAGGHGGQSVNTTDSAVRITHLPTGISVAIQNERSQLQNKEVAMTILRSRLIQMQIEQHKEKVSELKGPNQSAEWGNQIRSYVLHPYKQVKDLRSRYETGDIEGVLDGGLNPLIDAYLEHSLGQ